MSSDESQQFSLSLDGFVHHLQLWMNAEEAGIYRGGRVKSNSNKRVCRSRAELSEGHSAEHLGSDVWTSKLIPGMPSA